MPHIAERFTHLVHGIGPYHIAQLDENMLADGMAIEKNAKYPDDNHQDGRESKSGKERGGAGHAQGVVLPELDKGSFEYGGYFCGAG